MVLPLLSMHTPHQVPPLASDVDLNCLQLGSASRLLVLPRQQVTESASIRHGPELPTAWLRLKAPCPTKATGYRVHSGEEFSQHAMRGGGTFATSLLALLHLCMPHQVLFLWLGSQGSGGPISVGREAPLGRSLAAGSTAAAPFWPQSLQSLPHVCACAEQLPHELLLVACIDEPPRHMSAKMPCCLTESDFVRAV